MLLRVERIERLPALGIYDKNSPARLRRRGFRQQFVDSLSEPRRTSRTRFRGCFRLLLRNQGLHTGEGKERNG